MEFTSAWQYSPIRKQWYLCTFLPFQPRPQLAQPT